MVRTPGLGFHTTYDGGCSKQGAEHLGQSTRSLLDELGVPADALARLTHDGVVGTAAVTMADPQPA